MKNSFYPTTVRDLVFWKNKLVNSKPSKL